MLNLIVAPESISTKGERITKKIVKYLKNKGEEYSVYFSHDLPEVSKTTRLLIGQGENEFVLIGDDSVAHEFINSVKDLSKIRFGIIPTGKNDNFASFLKINSHPIRAIEQILERKIENIDYLIVNEQKVLNNVLIGASAELFDIYNGMKVKNAFSRKLVTMKYGNQFEGIELEIVSKSFKTKTAGVFDMSIANGGNHYKKEVSPLANVQDGLINFNYVDILDKIDRKKYLKKYRTGHQVYDQRTNQEWIQDISITPTRPDEKIRAVIDSNVILADSISVGIVEGGIKMFRNNKEV